MPSASWRSRDGLGSSGASSRANNCPQSFRVESSLVRHACRLLQSRCPWGSHALATEVEFPGGRTDVLLVRAPDVLIAVEAKLTRWREALNQAYRATAFAHHAYVLLPLDAAEVALGYQSLFREKQVGLCSISGGKLRILIQSPRLEPLLPGLTRRFLESSEHASALNHGTHGSRGVRRVGTRVRSKNRRGRLQTGLQG